MYFAKKSKKIATYLVLLLPGNFKRPLSPCNGLDAQDMPMPSRLKIHRDSAK